MEWMKGKVLSGPGRAQEEKRQGAGSCGAGKRGAEGGCAGDGGALEKKAVERLAARGYTVTCAESCTGGLLSGRLVNVPGVSDVYRVGFVTYSNRAKHRILKVRNRTLRRFGAVSPQTAREMALGAARAAGADAALAVTGIAGPDGGTEKKPVGLVYIGCSVRGKVTVRRYLFSGSRRQVRDASVTAALRLLCRCLKEAGR